MLTIYRRHSPNCSSKWSDRNKKNCRCRIWYDWNIDGKRVVKPIDPPTRNWQRAQQIAREMEADGLTPQKKTLLVEKACEEFLAEKTKEGLRDGSLYKYKLLLNQLKEFSKQNGLVFLSSFDLHTTSKFRQTWTNKGTAAQKKLEALKTFFKFCHEREYIKDKANEH